ALGAAQSARRRWRRVRPEHVRAVGIDIAPQRSRDFARGATSSGRMDRLSEPPMVDRHQMDERARRDPRIGPAIDRSLIDRARNGDLDAFESIVRARMDAVYRLTAAILGDEADARDAAQETFVAAWREIRRLREAERL